MNDTLSSLHFENVKIVRNTISFHINLLPCYPSHRWKHVRCLALELVIFVLTIVACYVSVSFLNACYVGWGALPASLPLCLSASLLLCLSASSKFYVPHLTFYVPRLIFYVRQVDEG